MALNASSNGYIITSTICYPVCILPPPFTSCHQYSLNTGCLMWPINIDRSIPVLKTLLCKVFPTPLHKQKDLGSRLLATIINSLLCSIRFTSNDLGSSLRISCHIHVHEATLFSAFPMPCAWCIVACLGLCSLAIQTHFCKKREGFARKGRIC